MDRNGNMSTGWSRFSGLGVVIALLNQNAWAQSQPADFHGTRLSAKRTKLPSSPSLPLKEGIGVIFFLNQCHAPATPALQGCTTESSMDGVIQRFLKGAAAAIWVRLPLSRGGY